MRVFSCENCDQLVFFDNSQCLRCETPLGYNHEERDVIALRLSPSGHFSDFAQPQRLWRRCGATERSGCNWLVPAADDAELCESCQLTRTRPPDDDVKGLIEFAHSETAKRRLIFQLSELDLPTRRRDERAGTGLAFDLLSSTATKVVTGHDDGIITLDLAEANGENREHLRLQFSEPYRTVLGHFRHEIGHYYWPLLVDSPELLAQCRALFGDDTQDYADALRVHYKSSQVDDDSWVTDHISRYATMHPFEDWAETFAHYLHILDTLQTAVSFGLGSTTSAETGRLTRRVGVDATRPDGSGSFDEVIDHWLELSYALNQINRSMGKEDLYPFVLAPVVRRKMAFIDHLINGRAHGKGQHQI